MKYHNTEDLKQHQSEHSNDKPFKCSHCCYLKVSYHWNIDLRQRFMRIIIVHACICACSFIVNLKIFEISTITCALEWFQIIVVHSAFGIVYSFMFHCVFVFENFATMGAVKWFHHSFHPKEDIYS